MDLSMYPPEIAAMMQAQMDADAQSHQAPPPLVTAIPASMPATAPNPPAQALPPPPAPQQPLPPPMLPSAPAARPMAPPAAAPMLPPSTPAQITPFPQQAPVMSQVSPAPKVDAQAHIDNSVQEPTRTFNLAYQPPPLPQFMGGGLVPNLGPYRPRRKCRAMRSRAPEARSRPRTRRRPSFPASTTRSGQGG
jgi:hypothetical protein